MVHCDCGTRTLTIDKAQASGYDRYWVAREQGNSVDLCGAERLISSQESEFTPQGSHAEQARPSLIMQDKLNFSCVHSALERCA